MPPSKKMPAPLMEMAAPTPPPMMSQTPPEPPHLVHPHWEEMGRKMLWTLIGILLVYGIVFLGTLIRNNIKAYETVGYADKMQRTIGLDAQGKATVKPDIAMTTLGMVVQAETVQAAQEQNSEVMNKLIGGLKALGISEADIQTSNYNVYPIYNYIDNERTQDGFEVSQSVTVKMRDVSIANAVFALAGEVGANSVGGLSFTIDSPEAYKAAAREDALRQINKKAQDLSRMLGVEIVGIVTYNEYESGGVQPYPMYDRAYGLGGGEGAPQIEPGTSDVYVNVSVIFEIR